ncbi:unnamed protein product [Effrenium voratum]|uniref:PDZ domain-containing protein n=1 Tax=Effrenium voratum TaxID=2562239 RepID=A0AA36J4P7_9DINO|nr:unnamed protein product [Effrenium voratum]
MDEGTRSLALATQIGVGERQVYGVNFAGATRGENINYVIPAFRVQALMNLHLKEQAAQPWRRLGFKTPGHGLTVIQPNQALYNFTEGCKEGVFVGRVHQDGFMSKAAPPLKEGSMLLSVAGRKLDGFGKADIKELMMGKAALEDLFFIQSDLKSEACSASISLALSGEWAGGNGRVGRH